MWQFTICTLRNVQALTQWHRFNWRHDFSRMTNCPSRLCVSISIRTTQTSIPTWCVIMLSSNDNVALFWFDHRPANKSNLDREYEVMCVRKGRVIVARCMQITRAQSLPGTRGLLFAWRPPTGLKLNNMRRESHDHCTLQIIWESIRTGAVWGWL